MAGYKSTAAALNAWICFEDEAGQGLRPPKGRTWGLIGMTPIDNTARAIKGARVETVEMHITNCGKADPAYGAGVREACERLGALRRDTLGG
jgi:hypothetical protein